MYLKISPGRFSYLRKYGMGCTDVWTLIILNASTQLKRHGHKNTDEERTRKYNTVCISQITFCIAQYCIVRVCNCSMFCCTLLYVHSSIAIILMGKRELIALLNLSSWCLVMVERLFLAVPQGCLQFVIVVFPDHTILLFLGK